MRTSLGEVTSKIGSGATPRGGKAAYLSRGIPFIRSQNVLNFAVSSGDIAYIDEDAAHMLRSVTVLPGDVLVNITGDSVARVARWTSTRKARVSQHVAIVRPDENVLSSRFLMYQLLSSTTQRELHQLSGAGGSRPALTKGMLELLCVNVPSLVQQYAISDVLGALDDKIAANRQMLAIANDLFRQSWLRLPNSSLRLGDISENIRENVTADNIVPDEKYVALEHFDKRSVFLERSALGAEVTSNKSRFKRRDTLFGKLRPYFHKVAVAPDNGVCSTDVLVIRANDSNLALFTAAAASSDEAVSIAVQNSNGTRMPRAKWEDIANLLIPDPSSDSSQEFTNMAGPLVERCNAAVQENQTLASTRDELLPLLMSGKITVRDAEAIAAEVI